MVTLQTPRNVAAASARWIAKRETYEGFPLYLRYPLGLDYDTLQRHYKTLVTLEHEFSFRQLNGAPEPAYNERLEEFDVAATRYFDQSQAGQVVLVETYGGKRIYYYYVHEDFSSDELVEQLRSHLPGLRLSASSRLDTDWTFIRAYAKDYLDDA